MGENRSLDDFLTPAGEASADEASDGDSSGEASADEASDGDSSGEASADESTRERNDADGSIDESDGGAVEADDADATGEDDTPRTTYRWSPDGDDCPACGATVERQWRDGDRFVCADCKEW